jgi:hypothetical protein
MERIVSCELLCEFRREWESSWLLAIRCCGNFLSKATWDAGYGYCVWYDQEKISALLKENIT